MHVEMKTNINRKTFIVFLPKRENKNKNESRKKRRKSNKNERRRQTRVWNKLLFELKFSSERFSFLVLLFLFFLRKHYRSSFWPWISRRIAAEAFYEWNNLVSIFCVYFITELRRLDKQTRMEQQQNEWKMFPVKWCFYILHAIRYGHK